MIFVEDKPSTMWLPDTFDTFTKTPAGNRKERRTKAAQERDRRLKTRKKKRK